MSGGMLIRLASGGLPVIGFLLLLVWLDSYKLVSPRRIAHTLATGAALAIAATGVNFILFPVVPHYAWAGVPVVEESLKAAVVVTAVRRGRVGFLIDGAIIGFAVGAGFAFMENLYYAGLLGTASPLVYVVRGFGTAMMHGGITAVIGILARAGAAPWRGAITGLLLGILVHGIYNFGVVTPVVATVVLLAGVPAVLAAVFFHGESGVRRWVGEGFDRELEMLRMITDGQFLDTPAGRYLQSLKAHFAPPVVADMLCLLQLSLELSLRAKGELLKREAGMAGAPDRALAQRLGELEYLERSVGRTGRRALAPLLGSGGRRAWQLEMLREAV